MEWAGAPSGHRQFAQHEWPDEQLLRRWRSTSNITVSTWHTAQTIHFHSFDMATIDIRIQRVAQLFNPLYPSPVHEWALNRDIEARLVDWAGELSPKEPLRLIVHAPESLIKHAASMRQAIHAHFQLAHTRSQRRHRRRMRVGVGAMVGACAVLGISLILRALLDTPDGGFVHATLGEGLLIIGWVAMWRPVEILLYERVQNRQENRLLDRLTRIAVDVEPAQADSWQSFADGTSSEVPT